MSKDDEKVYNIEIVDAAEEQRREIRRLSGTLQRLRGKSSPEILSPAQIVSLVNRQGRNTRH